MSVHVFPFLSHMLVSQRMCDDVVVVVVVDDALCIWLKAPCVACGYAQNESDVVLLTLPRLTVVARAIGGVLGLVAVTYAQFSSLRFSLCWIGWLLAAAWRSVALALA